MKKLLSVILAIALVFALASMVACSSDEDTTPDDTNTNSPANDDVNNDDANGDYSEITDLFGEVPDPAFTKAQYEKLQNGEITVGFSLEDLSQNYLVRMTEGFEAFWTEQGAVYGGTFSADGDVTLQASQIENCNSMGMDLICVASSSQASLSAACEAAMANGTMVIVRGEASIENCGYVPTGLETYRNYEMGWYMTDMAITYVSSVMPDMEVLKMAIGELTQASNVVEIFDGVRDRCAADGKAEVVFTKDMCLTIDDGYTVGEESKTYDPDIRAFVTFDEAPAIGYNNYIMSQPDLNHEEYITLATSASQESADLWELSKTNESIMRGYCGSEWQDVSEVINTCSYNCLLGLVETPGYVEYGKLGTDNVFGYSIDTALVPMPEAE